MATSVTLKSGNASSGGNNASGALILQTGLNYGTGASTITFKTRTAGADTSTPGDPQDTLILNTANEVVVNEGKLKLGSTLVTATAAELNVLDGVTAGTATASKAVVLDANKDIGTIRNLTIDGTFSDGNYTFDTSGNVSGLGTVGCGAITSSGNLAVTGTITGDTSLTLDSTTITTAEIGVLDGVTAGTATASKALVLDASKNIATIGTIGCGAITSTGTSSFAGGITPASADGAALGSSDKEWSDLYLADSSVIYFGADSEITLTHVHNEGLALKHTSFNDSTPIKLTLQSSEGAIVADDVLGQIDFQASGEESGSDATLVAAGIAAVAEGTFSATANATKLSFKTAASETASEKMSLSSGGNLTVSGNVITSGLSDANGNEQLVFTTTASAVNHFSITNASSGNKPKLAAVGDDSNIDLALTPKGTGNVDITTGGLSIYHTDTPSTGKIYIGGNFTTSFATNATSGYIIDVVANTVTDEVTAADGTRNEFFGTRLAKPTISSTNTNVIVTKGATLYIADKPGTNANVSFGTNSALHIDNGGMFVQGPSTLTGELTVKGAQGLTVGSNTTTTGKLSLYSAGSANTTTISAHTNATGTATYYLPAADGSANQVLKTDGSGNLSWVAQGSGGSIDGLSDAKKGGANFGGSMLIGRTNTGTLSAAVNNIGIGLSSVHATSGPFRSLTSGTRNVVIGSGNCGDALTEGVENTIIGNNAGSALISGSSNVIIGGQTGTSLAGATNAVKNVLIGHLAGGSVESGSNTIIGGGAPGSTLTTGINNMCIGFGANVSSATVNNEITLGNSSVTELRCADTTITSLSDARDKTDVIDLPWGLDFVDSLRPVQFTWDRRVLTPEDENWAMNGKKRAGFLAQELQTAMTDNANDVLDLVYESNPDRLEVKMGKLVPMLTQAIKELKAEVDTLKAEVAALKNA